MIFWEASVRQYLKANSKNAGKSAERGAATDAASSGASEAATEAGVPARSLWHARCHSRRVKKPMREAWASQARKRTRRSAGSRPMAEQRAPTPSFF